MNWKTETTLGDMDPDRRIEMTCKSCGKLKILTPAELLKCSAGTYLYLDQVEWAQQCRDKRCKGAVSLSLSHNRKSQGFVAGMP